MPKAETKVFFEIDKNNNFGEWFNEIVALAEIVDKRYPVKGMDIFLGYGYAIHDKIMRTLEDLFDNTDIPHEKVLFPTLIPEDEFSKEADHIKGFEDSVYWITHGGFDKLDRRLIMRPTSEVAMYPWFSLKIRSHSDLPVKIYQTCSVFRYETKMTKSLIRVREIPWNEGHTAHATWEEARAHIDEVWDCYHGTFDEMGITGLHLVRPDWDKFPGGEFTTVLDAIMPNGMVLQCAGNHLLGQKFAKVFDIKYKKPEGGKEHVYQTCYGVSTRLLAHLLAQHGDDKGLCIPYGLAPIQVVIVPILYKKTREKVLERVEEIRKDLRQHKIRVKVDLSDKQPGAKFYFWEMKGVPIRLEIGSRDIDKGKATVFRRDTGEKLEIPFDDLPKEIPLLGDQILKNLRQKAEEDLQRAIHSANTLEETRNLLSEKGGFVRVPLCTVTDASGKECDETIKEHTGGEVRGPLYPEPEKADKGSTCISCGKPAPILAYIAKAY
ncbi:MAG: proline--tRNA ligase [Promethearchaeota archaeon]